MVCYLFGETSGLIIVFMYLEVLSSREVYDVQFMIIYTFMYDYMLTFYWISVCLIQNKFHIILNTLKIWSISLLQSPSYRMSQKVCPRTETCGIPLVTFSCVVTPSIDQFISIGLYIDNDKAEADRYDGNWPNALHKWHIFGGRPGADETSTLVPTVSKLFLSRVRYTGNSTCSITFLTSSILRKRRRPSVLGSNSFCDWRLFLCLYERFNFRFRNFILFTVTWQGVKSNDLWNRKSSMK